MGLLERKGWGRFLSWAQARFNFMSFAFVLILANLVVFWQVRNFDFINLDDNTYITENLHILNGFSLASVTWAFADFGTAGLWQPLVWLSFLLDVKLFGLSGGGFHLTNLFLHILNSLLLFFILIQIVPETRGAKVWRCATVAALFALHPLHVESVAWVTERKDVLSTFFGFCSLGFYFHYVRNSSRRMYFLCLLFFSFSLLSKAMWVTLPLLLLLLDFWPLRRSRLPLLREKLPFFGLSLLMGLVTLVAQKSAMASLEQIPFWSRVGNAVYSYVRYLGKFLWPSDLAIFYPYHDLPLWKVGGSFAFLVIALLFLLRFAKKWPWLAFAGAWYFVTLLPVIGVVQVGDQALADRFTYLPSVGLLIGVVWSVPGHWKFGDRLWRVAVGFASVVVLLLCGFVSQRQVAYWKNSQTVFERALSVTSNNYLAQNNLGVYLAQQGKPQEAVSHYLEAIRINSNYPDPHSNLGSILVGLGRLEEGVGHLIEALRITPSHALAHYNLGVVRASQGKTQEAMEHYRSVLKTRPESVDAHNNLAVLLDQEGRTEEAIAHYSEALKVQPSYAISHNDLGVILVRQGKTAEAISHYLQAVQIEPRNAVMHMNLALAYLSLRDLKGFEREYRAVQELDPKLAAQLELSLNSSERD